MLRVLNSILWSFFFFLSFNYFGHFIELKELRLLKWKDRLLLLFLFFFFFSLCRLLD
jgi:hypothetical protein